jgi:tetratricopeptide (TPR) repeat protein
LPIDREGALLKADKFVRQGRLDQAIAEYERVVEDQPHDWSTANTLGDVYVRDGQTDRAVSTYHRIADHLLAQGFSPKAAAVYKKILKIAPGDENAPLQLAQISARQGLLAEARGYLNAVLARRQSRGDAAGVEEILRRLGSLEPPKEVPVQEAERVGAEQHPMLPLARLELDLREGRTAAVPGIVAELLTGDPPARESILSLASTFADTNPAGASACVEAVADHLAAAGDHKGAAGVLRAFAMAAPGRTSALLKLVEICVEGGFEADTYDAQAQLARAYLVSGRGAEARMIFEDLVTHEPWDSDHIDGLRQSLALLNIPDIEAVVAKVVNSAGTEDVEGADVVDLPIVQEVTAPVQSPAPGPSPIEIDLTSILTDLHALDLPSTPAPPVAPPPQDLDRVFATMRDDADRVKEDDDAGEYMALARTYAEMGKRTEAAAALQTAVESPAFRFEAASMLAQFARERGDLVAAIDWFERAAEVPAPTVEDGRALLYELGAMLERTGEAARALAVFLELQAEAGDYRDLGRRIATLSRSQAGG